MFLVAALLLLPLAGVKAAEDVRTPENRVIYEVFVRNFSPAGNFKGLEAQVPRLRQLGVDVLWLMPVYKLGDTGKWGAYSSPYAIKNYKQVDPDNGTEQDLRDLVKTIHDNGMEIWFDWVGNHTSMDNEWVYSHPEYYTKNNGNFVHPFNGAWADVYELDKNNTEMQEAMIDAMQYWVDNFDIDGYRCDYASGPSEELWRKASSRVLKNGKRIAWLAEDDPNFQLVSNGYFDYNYAWEFYDRMREFAAGGSLANFKNECKKLHDDQHYAGRSRMVFLSNHDRVQDDGGTEDRFFGAMLKPMTVLEFTIYGMPLLYNGQEIQYKSGRVSLAEKTPIDWSNPDASMTDLISRLCNLKHTQPALRTSRQNGSLSNLSTSDDNSIYVYRRSLESSDVVVMLNFSNASKSFTVNSGLPSGVFTDVFSGKSVDFSSVSSFTLPAYGYAVYAVSDGVSVDPPTPVETSYIYLKNNKSWNPLYLYGYNESTGEIESNAPFGAWPGVALTVTVVKDGETWYSLAVPEWMKGRSYSLIANNNNSEQIDLPFTTFNGDVYIEVGETDDEVFHIYVDDRTGWESVGLYGWADGEEELFGGWPGNEATGSYVVNGIDFKRVRIPQQHNFKSYNLIVNNLKNDDGKKQYDFDYKRLDKDIYLRLNPDKAEELNIISTGAVEVGADDDNAQYYTVTGLQVERPSGGVFIEVKGVKRRKVCLNNAL